MALDLGGEIDCVGYSSWGATEAPSGTWHTLVAGSSHACALSDLDDTVDCWGADEHNQSSPWDRGPFVALGAGDGHTCAIDAAGEAYCWGYNDYGQIEVPPGPWAVMTGGFGHTCGIHTDGSLECWGDDAAGQATPP